MRAEPIVSGLKKEWDGEVIVLQLNIHEKENLSIIKQLDAQFTPTFVLFDSSGTEVWRQVGIIDAEEARRQFTQLKS